MAAHKDGHTHQQAPVSWQKRLRVALALVMLLALTAAFVDFRELVPVRTGHWLASVQFVPALLAMASGALVPALLFVALLLLTLLAGRVYCSVLCPLGLLQDVISRAARLFRGKGKRKPLPFAREQVWLRHGFVWGTVAAALLGWGACALTLLDPYSHFGRISSILFRPALTWVNNHVVWIAEAAGWNSLYRVDLPLPGLGALLFPALVLTVLVVLAALRGRLWCNTVCPVGTVLGWLSRHAAFRIGIDKGACTKCAQCIRACKAQCIDLRAAQVDFSRCVACYDCVSVCDERGIGYKWSWGRKAPALSEARDPGRRTLLKNSVQGLFLGSGLAFLSRKARAQEGGYGEDVAAKPASPASSPQSPTALNVEASPRTGSLGVAPPGAVSVPRFLDRCTACQLCVSACPKHVLQPALFEYGLKGFMKPRLDFTASFCDYDCRACAEACPDNAIELLPLEDKQLAQIGVAHFHEDRCIVKVKGTDCAACSEHCPTKAVATVPFGDNLRLPQVDENLCIGCGACQFACPVQPEKAILVAGLREHGRAVRAPRTPQPNAPRAPAGDFPF